METHLFTSMDRNVSSTGSSAVGRCSSARLMISPVTWHSTQPSSSSSARIFSSSAFSCSAVMPDRSACFGSGPPFFAPRFAAERNAARRRVGLLLRARAGLDVRRGAAPCCGGACGACRGGGAGGRGGEPARARWLSTAIGGGGGFVGRCFSCACCCNSSRARRVAALSAPRRLGGDAALVDGAPPCGIALRRPALGPGSVCSEGGSFFGTAAVPSPGRIRAIGCCNAPRLYHGAWPTRSFMRSGLGSFPCQQRAVGNSLNSVELTSVNLAAAAKRNCGATVGGDVAEGNRRGVEGRRRA